MLPVAMSPMRFVGVSLTRKVAMAVPMIKPAMTSDQWFRYSATRFRPVRNARHTSPRDSTGLARRVPFACTVHVTYICQGREVQALVHWDFFFTSCKSTGPSFIAKRFWKSIHANIIRHYCNTLFACFSQSALAQIKLFLNPAARLLTKTQLISHYSRFSLHWFHMNLIQGN